MMTMTVFNKQ